MHEQQEDENAEHDEHHEHDKEEAGAAPDGHAKLRKPKANDEVSFYLVSEPSTRVLKAEDIKVELMREGDELCLMIVLRFCRWDRSK